MSLPRLEVGESVLIAPGPDDAPWRMVVDLVQDGQITLAAPEEELPREWKDLDEVMVTCLGRFSIYLIHVPVVRSGPTRLVIGEPSEQMPVQRRAYARVNSPVPATYMRLDQETNRFVLFDGEVRDLGGGGCAILSSEVPDDGSSLVISFQLDDRGPLVIVGRVLPRQELPTIGKPMTRVEFVLIRESDRDRVLRFVLMALAGVRRAQKLGLAEA
ncbi:MAG TPA: PilZ domain-containing protein [Acidimicrobiia bacterium]|nr:PilZ domain-containing protein [Acidimicrobiia bacterium]